MIPEFRERPTTYFKASEEFLTATKNQSLKDKNLKVKKILEDE